MADRPVFREVSFFKLAEQYEMARLQRRRWRDRRDTLPARRRRRRARLRSRRQQLRLAEDYRPIEADAGEAHRGVRARLLGAMVAAFVTALCLASLVVAAEFTLASTFAVTVAIGSLGLSVSLAMSAREEEIVHQVAGHLTAELEEPPRPALPPSPGWVGFEDGNP